MRATLVFCLAILSLPAVASAQAEEKERPLYNVEIVDASGLKSQLVAFYRLSADDKFRGFRGSAQIEVPYDRIRTMQITPPGHPGGRMQIVMTLQSGKQVDASFDDREGELLFGGFTEYGRARIYFRDIRSLKFLGKTRREDLPKFGKPGPGVDVRLTDKKGVTTELVAFRRRVGENALHGVLGSMSVEIPLRIVRALTMIPADGPGLYLIRITLKGDKRLEYRLPVYEEKTYYGGDAEFGEFRIHLGDIRTITVHRATPQLRALDPLAASEGRQEPETQPAR